MKFEDGAVELPALAGRLNAVLPAGIRVLSAYESARKVKELTRLQAEVTLEYDGGIPEGAQQALGAFFARESIVITKHSKKGDKEVDIKPLLHSLDSLDLDHLTDSIHHNESLQITCIDVNTILTVLIGDHFSLIISKQIIPINKNYIFNI